MLTSADRGAVIVPSGSSCIDSSDDSSSESGPNKLRCGVGGLADSTGLAFIRNCELGWSIRCNLRG